MTSRMDMIRQRIDSALTPLKLEITDDSHLHVGHDGARGGAGHYSVLVVADKFAGLSRIKRHQAIYAAVSDMMPDEIHALSIVAQTPQEADN